jgi:hypothetical protein
MDVRWLTCIFTQGEEAVGKILMRINIRKGNDRLECVSILLVS